jgi:hypothetical protein
MLCDCYRGKPFVSEETYENRFLQGKTPFGLTKMVCLQNTQDQIRIHAEFPPHSPFHPMDQQGRCSPGLCNHPPKHNDTMNASLFEILPQLQPTHIFASLGWEKASSPERLSQFLAICNCLSGKIQVQKHS